MSAEIEYVKVTLRPGARNDFFLNDEKGGRLISRERAGEETFLISRPQYERDQKNGPRRPDGLPKFILVDSKSHEALPKERAEKIVAAWDKIPHATDTFWTRAGNLDVAKFSEVVGFEVTRKEMDAAFYDANIHPFRKMTDAAGKDAPGVASAKEED